ncbi:hypothetical protein OG609_28355 [Streptomyces sp. NBC_01224]|uniref:hypothetical protein n=2 Tax=unclassified Streptomyces TaxID=2593676 RepID=UPI002E12DE93|nr:hypothetical protein OG609_28355 [Streptomyces sp. NBC_01224]
MRRPLLAVGAIGMALWTLTACGKDPEACEMIDAIPSVSVTWQVDELPYDDGSSYRLCVGARCETGAPRVYGDTVRVSLRLPDGFDERRQEVRLRLSGPQDAPELDESRTVTLREARAGCDKALIGTLRLTADGALEERGR